MIKALTRPAFDVLALFYDRGSDFVSGIELSRYHRHCFYELLESGLLAPATPLKHFEEEGLDGRPEPFFIQKSPDGILGHLCPDRGWVKIKDEERKHYRLSFEPLMGTVKATLDLKGQKHVAVEGLCFLGLCQFGKQKIEVYWSSCLSVEQSSSVKAFMNQRFVLQPAVVLHKSVQCCRYELGGVCVISQP